MSWKDFQSFFVRQDPGFGKLLAASRGTVAVALTYFFLAKFSQALNFSPLLSFIGVLISLMSSLLVVDPSRDEQKKTFFWIALSASLALALGVIFSRWHFLQLTFFLALSYFAIFLRRYGLRGLAVGMLIFMAYFCTLFFPLEFSDLIWSLGALLFSVFLSFCVRFYFLPDQPRWQLRWTRQAFRWQLIRTLEKLADGLENLNSPDQLLESLRPELRSINQLSFEGETRINSIDTKLSLAEIDHYRTQLFEVELAVRKAIETSWSFFGSPEAMPADLKWLASELRNLSATAWNEKTEPQQAPICKIVAPSKAREKVAQALDDVRAHWKFSSFDPTFESNSPLLDESPKSVSNENLDLLLRAKFHPNTIVAFQVTLATGLAAWAGTFVSKDRWYWAAVTAFVLFTGAARGETITRAILRVLATVLGLIVGFYFVYLMAGHRNLEGALIFVCVFFGIYLARVAYGFWTALFFTLLLAIFYDFLGQMTVEVLFLRLNETLIGALISGFVSFFVFPTSTRSTVRQALAKLLKTASSVLDQIPQKSDSPFSRRTLIRHLRSVDQELFNLRTAAGPLQGKLIFAKGNEIPNLIHEASLLTHYIRKLGTSMAGQLSKEQENQILDLVRATQNLATELETKTPNDRPSLKTTNQSSLTSVQDSELAHWSNRIFQILESLKQRMT